MPLNNNLERLKDIPFPISTIENIDKSMIRYIDEELNLFATTNKGWTKVPVVWSGAERPFQSKKDSQVRDNTGTLILPLITIERTSVTKSLSKKGTVWGNVLPVDDEKGGTIPVARRINHQKTSNFVNAKTKKSKGRINFPNSNYKKVVYETVTIPIPVYIVANYEITIRTEYQQQMNEIITPFATVPGGINYILLKNQNHRYEGFIREVFAQNNNYTSFTDDERKIETKINIEVLGYLLGEDKNRTNPNFVFRESSVEVKIPRERIVFNDELENDGGSFYGLSGIPEDSNE